MFPVETFALYVSYSRCPLDLQQRSEKELKKVVTPEDAPTALRLVIHDAATFDVATGQGGLNGSIITRCTFPHPHIAIVNTKKQSNKLCLMAVIMHLQAHQLEKHAVPQDNGLCSIQSSPTLTCLAPAQQCVMPVESMLQCKSSIL